MDGHQAPVREKSLNEAKSYADNFLCKEPITLIQRCLEEKEKPLKSEVVATQKNKKNFWSGST